MNVQQKAKTPQEAEFIRVVIADYQLACESREASLLGRKEVLTGKAKFGIFGDGKEVAQLAMAKQFRNGDFRSGYYRDQTFMMAIGALSIQQCFAALYAHPDLELEPASSGRQMGGHFSTRSLDSNGNWKNLMAQKNSSADISPTAGQMPRLLGLAQASKVYRQNEELHQGFDSFTSGGDEVAFGTIGDASTSEGLFFETMNAAGVLQVPMVMSVWDDGFGISVPRHVQTTKGSISELLKGFQREKDKPGFEIFKVKGWDYAALVHTYEQAVSIARTNHVPVLIHVEDLTQPQGHSTSGSHERYKSADQLQWTKDFDCLVQMRKWMLEHDLAEADELDTIEAAAKKTVREAQKAAWQDFQSSLTAERDEAVKLLQAWAGSTDSPDLQQEADQLRKSAEPIRKEIYSTLRRQLLHHTASESSERQAVKQWLETHALKSQAVYSDHLLSESHLSPLLVEATAAAYPAEAEMVDGRIVLRDNFDALFKKFPEILMFGEDVGKIGGVNQSMENMQERFGELRVADVGIREASIVGQGIGMAMRGLRPIAEIQYLDYLLYALQIMSDDLATVRYRTRGGQKAPLIVRTRGHRLEGIWHSGSPMGTIINALRGVHVCVPRNMTTAAGFYNTLLQGDDPALVVEPLNGYRIKESKPENLGEFTISLGVPEIVREGKDITLVSYGSTFNLCIEAANVLADLGIELELVDVRTLLPFDVSGMIGQSLSKTNRLLIVDEDVPGGASAFMLERILGQEANFYQLDSPPKVLSAKAHRPAYGTDGDYFSKPNIEDVVETAYAMMREFDPSRYPAL